MRLALSQYTARVLILHLILHLILTGGLYESFTLIREAAVDGLIARQSSIIAMSCRFCAPESCAKATLRRMLLLCSMHWQLVSAGATWLPSSHHSGVARSVRPGRLWKFNWCRKVNRCQIKRGRIFHKLVCIF